MFIKVESKELNRLVVTDVIKRDKVLCKYRHILNIIKNLRFLFRKKQETKSGT